jgi:hypothetical protein
VYSIRGSNESIATWTSWNLNNYARYECDEKLECLCVSIVIIPGAGQFVSKTMGKADTSSISIYRRSKFAKSVRGRGTCALELTSAKLSNPRAYRFISSGGIPRMTSTMED